MIKVGIVGCGKIADQHVGQILHMPDARIVGVCDREELMAQQLRERVNAPNHFSEVQRLLDEARPDVVHITSPPQSHYSIAKMCIASGCHVYVEKPFTVTYDEAEDLINLATRQNIKLTVGHNAQFSHASIEMRRLVSEGYLGGAPLHMESYYCYNLSDPAYAKALLGDPYHWIRGLPGGLLQNTISHGISKVAEFFKSPEPLVIANGFTSKVLRSVGEKALIDELRVIIRDDAATAYFTFSSQMRPSLFHLRLYGPTNGLILDEQSQTVIKMSGGTYKSYLQQFLPQWSIAKQYAKSSLGNMRKFIGSDFPADYGMRTLIKKFYGSIDRGEPLPIPFSEILRTSRIMDDIFGQLQAEQARSSREEQVVQYQD